MMSGSYQRHAEKVYTRDNFTCRACNFYSEYGMMLSLDHIKARSEGGSDKPENLQCLCIYCNALKGNKKAPVLQIRQKPGPSMTLGEYQEMLLSNRRAFYTSIYGKASRGWFLRQEKTLLLLEKQKWTQSQRDKLRNAIEKTFKATNTGQSYFLEKLKEYKEKVLLSTPANMQCKFAY